MTSCAIVMTVLAVCGLGWRLSSLRDGMSRQHTGSAKSPSGPPELGGDE